MTEQPKKSPVLLIVIVIIVIGVAVGVYFALSGDETTETNTNTAAATTNTNTAADPYADLMKYDDKTIDITSADEKVEGKIAISIDLTQEYPINVLHFIKITESLPQTATGSSGLAYNYLANHTQEEFLRTGEGTGSLAAAFCNPDQMPDVLTMAQQRSIDADIYYGCDDQYDPWHTTDVFFNVYGSYYNHETWSYASVIGRDKFAVYNASPFYYEYTEQGVQGWKFDNDQVIKEGEITASYDLIYTE
ncbi:hypothetical protein KKI23_02700 [Patescibacteria group bacterium]|nr:hypothetical protein [Patescibacteria group bacterium]